MDNTKDTDLVVASASVRSTLYKPLQPWQTRVIALLPGEFSEPLKCELHVAETVAFTGLGLAPESCYIQYEALSYSWGRPDLTAEIECNGVITYVPPPMAEGLRHLRYTDRKRWLWCDALCINQHDNDEKSLQVRNMLLIFEKAERVVAWLGYMDDRLLAFLQRVYEQIGYEENPEDS